MTDREAKLREYLQDRPEDAFLNYGLAEALAARGAVEEAVERLDVVLGLDPNYVAAYLRKGMFLAELDRRAEAQATLKSGIGVARAVGDGHAASEMQGFLDELDDD